MIKTDSLLKFSVEYDAPGPKNKKSSQSVFPWVPLQRDGMGLIYYNSRYPKTIWNGF